MKSLAVLAKKLRKEHKERQKEVGMIKIGEQVQKRGSKKNTI